MQIWGLWSLMAATGHWARWKHTWASGMWPSSREGEGRGVVVGGEAWPGVSPASCLHCHPSSGPLPTYATSHWASGMIKPHYRALISAPICVWVMDMIQHSQWRKHLKLHLPVGLCLQKKNNNTEREWKIMIIKKKNAHHSRNATFRPHY